ncbi:GEVED domain-containing protein, partial [Moorena sp. SIO3H5]|uniref:GEVED domain-containing protein n=1 Tax=Moorena sp. SIO3H5 TaxID=2607834 RepID=UPI0013B66EE4
ASDKDFGDAPDTGNGTSTGNYNTLLSDNGPSHDIDGSTYLGSWVTTDTDGFGDGTDTNNNATDDTDDGVLLNSETLQGQSLTTGSNVTLNLTTAGSGVLNAWIDWNSDGDFNDTNEQIATNVSPSGNAIALNVTVPADATVGNTYARFRYSSDTGLSPTGAASNGEVEDYQIAIATPAATTVDYGDAPDTYGTDATAGNSGSDPIGASHDIVSGIHLGTAPDGETDAATPLDGSGDGTEDDGITLLPLTAGSTGYVIEANNITATNTGTATLHAWIDFDKSGTFESSEYASVEITNGTPAASGLSWNNISVGSVGNTYARFRFTTDPTITAATPGGAASDGEVEDYQVAIVGSGNPNQTIDDTPSGTSCAVQGGVLSTVNIFTPYDNGTFGFEDGSATQSPATNPYAGISGGDYAQYKSRPNNSSLETPLFGEYSFVANIVVARNRFQHEPVTDPVYGVTGRFFATDPDIDSIPELGITITGLIPNQFYEISFWAANSEPNGTPNEIDVFLDNESVYSTGPLPAVPSALAWKKHTFTFTNGPKTSIELQIKSTEAGRGGLDFYLDNIELRNCNFGIDYGDAPASYGDALHTTIPISPTVYLGSAPDIESQTQLSSNGGTNADGDDTNNNDDEDAFTTLPNVPLTGTYNLTNIPVTNTSGVDATLHGWIDFDQDGKFEVQEYQSQTVSNGATTANLTWTVPEGTTAGNSYARFRITQNALIPDDPSTADVDERSKDAVINGEVEDYQIAIGDPTPTTASVGDKIWEDLDGDGIQDAGEPGIANALVNIYKSDNTFVDATFTDSNGNYSFSNLDPGDYIIEFTSPAVGYNFTSQDGGDDTLDSDADPVTGRTATFTLAAGDNNTSIDAGLTLKTNTIVACDVIPRQRTNWTETLNVQKFDSAQGSLASVDLTLSTLIEQELIYENTVDQPKTITVNQEGDVSVSLPDTNANFTRNYNQSIDFNLPASDGNLDFSGTSGGTTPTILAYETHTEEYTNLADFISSSSPVETVSIEVNTTSTATFINSDNASTGSSSEATAGLCVTYTYSLIPEEPSPEAGNIVINEVLYAQTGSSAEANDEFIELYNASDNAVDISNWRLADSNLIFNSTDNTGNITGDAANPAYIFPNNTTLQPGEYAVIWIGNNTSDHQAPDAAFQDWLGNAAKLNNAGEDIWLYDDELKIVDYIAYGSNNAINTPPSAGLNLWDDTYQGDLDGAATGQSISLTPNGEDGNTSACWEHTLSNDADGRCPEFLETRDTDTVSVRQTSVGVYNNILPNVILVKRITAIKPKDTNEWIDLPESGSPFIDGIDGGSSENNVNSERAADDNDPNWPNPDVYLRGLINSGQVMPGDELEYTVYFLSNGSNDATNLRICDRVPGETTFIPDSFNATAGFPSSDVGIALFQSTSSLPSGGPAEPNIYLTNIPDSDRGRYYEPGTSVPSGCNVTFNQNGVVVVEVGDVPNADSPGNPPNSYGFIRFRALVK